MVYVVYVFLVLSALSHCVLFMVVPLPKVLMQCWCYIGWFLLKFISITSMCFQHLLEALSFTHVSLLLFRMSFSIPIVFFTFSIRFNSIGRLMKDFLYLSLTDAFDLYVVDSTITTFLSFFK